MSKPAVVDTHAHLTDEAFAESLPLILDAARQAGVIHIGVIGFDLQSSRAACELADRYAELLFASVGIQPHSSGSAAEDDWAAIERLATHPRVRALGETGLDLYWDDTPLNIQQEYFERHIHLSSLTSLPLVIHLRDSGRQIVDQLRPHHAAGTIRGVMHSFTGDQQTCRDCLDMGLYISFAGMVTFKKSEALRAIAAYVPADRLLVETDCPYLSPEPFRGKRPNEPARVVHTLEVIAQARGVSYQDLALQTTDNAKRLFGLTSPAGTKG
ncbi:MAG: TatD family hydrolase [Planctomycetaceae bacterium]